MTRNTSNNIALVGKVSKFVVTGAAATLIAIGGLAPALYAAPSGNATRVVVKYDADQAKTERGALELYNRLSEAAAQVCPSDLVGSLNGVARARGCQREALARAVATIHTRRLVEIAADKANRG